MIIAKQVPPEYQISPLIQYEEIPEDVFVFGNRNYIDHTTDLFNIIPQLLDTLADELEILKSGRYLFTDFAQILRDNLQGEEFTRADRLKWIELIEKWETTDEEGTIFADVLALLLGKPFEFGTIRGCCQGDWQYIIYPAEYGREWLKNFEIEYFNLGSEWDVFEDNSNDPDYRIYCTSFDPRKELSDITGELPENIKLYAFDGWTRAPKYREVQP